MTRAALIALLLSTGVQADRPGPVGLALAPAGAELVRDAAITPLNPGDLLFAGDTIRTRAPMTLLFCPQKSTLTLAAQTRAVIEPAAITIESGRLLNQKTVGACFLPPVVRLATASTQQSGAQFVRGEDDLPYEPTPRDQWPDGLAGELPAPAADPVSHLSRAALFERYRLQPDAVNEYLELLKLWPDAGWITRKISDLNRAIAIKRARKKHR